MCSSVKNIISHKNYSEFTEKNVSSPDILLFLNLSPGLSDRADREETPAHIRFLCHGRVLQPTYSLPQFPGKPRSSSLVLDREPHTAHGCSVPSGTISLHLSPYVLFMRVCGDCTSSIFHRTEFHGCPTSATSVYWLWSRHFALGQVKQPHFLSQI